MLRFGPLDRLGVRSGRCLDWFRFVGQGSHPAKAAVVTKAIHPSEAASSRMAITVRTGMPPRGWMREHVSIRASFAVPYGTPGFQERELR